MLKSLTDLSADSLKKAVSSAFDRMDDALHRQLRAYRRVAVAGRRVNNAALPPLPFNGLPMAVEPNGPPNGRFLMYNQQPNYPPKQAQQSERISIDSEHILSYGPDEKSLPGVYIGAKCLRFRPDSCDYFEVEVLDSGLSGDIALGLVPWNHPLDQLPGFIAGSVGYHAGDGKIYLGHQRGSVVGSKCDVGDKLGCGIRLEKPLQHLPPGLKVNKANLLPYHSNMMKLRVFFTLNGIEVASTLLTPLLLRGGLYPAVALGSPGEEVKLSLEVPFVPAIPKSVSDDSLMCVDSYEDDWMRLSDIRLNGTLLEYSGRGKSILDVGLAQARKPLDTRYHYFEIEIVDPGENCYIAIGLTKKDYPHQSHPGWNKGSIAYHADDGKLFMGSGAGDPFGPQCHRGDVMGCGIIFPTDVPTVKSASGHRKADGAGRRHSCEDSDELINPESSSEEPTHSEFSSQSEPEEEEDDDESQLASDDSDGLYEPIDANGWGARADDYRLLAIGRGFPVHFMQERRVRRLQQRRRGDSGDVSSGPKVEVFFSRNGVIIGQKEIAVPKGGFFPTIGMLSSSEKVKVDLHPLSG